MVQDKMRIGMRTMESGLIRDEYGADKFSLCSQFHPVAIIRSVTKTTPFILLPGI